MGSHTITRPAGGVLLEIEFSVRSNTARAAVLLWLSSDGSAREYARLRLGAEGEVVHTQTTFEGDTWIVREEATGRELLRHTATRDDVQRLQVRDGEPGVAPAAAEGGPGVDGVAGADDEELQRALALSLAEQASIGGSRDAAGSAAAPSPAQPPAAEAATRPPGQRATSDQPSAKPSAQPCAQLPVTLDEALALSAQLAAQHGARARARAELGAGWPGAEARLQVRFAQLDGPALTIRLGETETLQPLLDAALVRAEGMLADEPELRVESRMPQLALRVARSGLVRGAQPADAHLRTVGELGLLPSAVLHVTVSTD